MCDYGIAAVNGTWKVIVLWLVILRNFRSPKGLIRKSKDLGLGIETALRTELDIVLILSLI